jgi:hypothetical protein
MALIAPSPQSSSSPTNEQVQDMLGQHVAKVMLGAVDDTALVKIGPLAINNFSFTFSVDVSTSGGQRNAFVKIPKVDMRCSMPSILPITFDDRGLAKEEESSLRLLDDKWQADDLDVRWVKICGTFPEFNALITDRIFADEAFAVFRRFDLRRRFGFRQDGQRLQCSMARLGSALGRFHHANSRPVVFRLAEALPKLEFYCREIAASTGSVWPERVLWKLQSMGDMEVAGIEVPTLKGIDIRNVLIDGQDRLYLLDPGRTKITHREADLARFIMTYRILYWGSKLLLLVREPDPKAETAFLESYYSHSQPACPQLLNFFLLKEQLKHWHTAYDSVQRRPWPSLLKRIVVKTYVNPFYRRQITAQLKLIRNWNK